METLLLASHKEAISLLREKYGEAFPEHKDLMLALTQDLEKHAKTDLQTLMSINCILYYGIAVLKFNGMNVSEMLEKISHVYSSIPDEHEAKTVH